MSVPTPSAILQALDQHPLDEDFSLPGRTNHIQAATLVPLRWTGGLSTIFTVRSAGLREHAGEVCFPGGTPLTPEEDLENTAIREAEEELGISAPRILGRLSRIPVYTSEHRITPFVAAIDDAPLRPYAGEVAQVLEVPILGVLEQPSIEGLPFPMKGAISWSPIFHVDGHIIYGATAHTFWELLDILAPLYGRTCPPFAKGETEWADVLPPGVSI